MLRTHARKSSCSSPPCVSQSRRNCGRPELDLPGRPLLYDGSRDGRSRFRRTAGRVRQCAPCVLVAGRELCRGEELASSGKFARPDLRAGLFPLALGDGLRIQALCTRLGATGTGSARLIQQQRPVTPLECCCARQQFLTALGPSLSCTCEEHAGSKEEQFPRAQTSAQRRGW